MGPRHVRSPAHSWETESREGEEAHHKDAKDTKITKAKESEVWPLFSLGGLCALGSFVVFPGSGFAAEKVENPFEG